MKKVGPVTGWFEEYCAANTHTAFTADGWPVAESVPRKIADALGAALAPYDPPADLIEHAAAQIYAASEFGRFEERPGNLLASARRSEKELAEFQKLTAKLADLIDGMHGPAVTALSREGLIARDLLEPLQRAHERVNALRAPGWKVCHKRIRALNRVSSRSRSRRRAPPRLSRSQVRGRRGSLTKKVNTGIGSKPCAWCSRHLASRPVQKSRRRNSERE